METAAFDATHEQELDFDVAIVGYGPVGQALSCAARASQGHRVCVVERSCWACTRCRAHSGFDGEAMRMFQRLGIVDELRAGLGEMDRFGRAWIGADGAPTLRDRHVVPACLGLASRDYLFYQPALEGALDRAARAQPTLDLRSRLGVRGESCRTTRYASP